MTGPWARFDEWMLEAERTEPRVADAMQLATSTPDGHPSVRTVLLKRWGPDEGLVFYTNYESRKGRELLDNPNAAVCLHFKGLARQILADGPVERVSAQESDDYFASRVRGSQLGAWASAQSRPVGSREALDEALVEVAARFEGQDVPRPPNWGGYRLWPRRIEFWQGRVDRLHDREVFDRDGDTWTMWLAQP